MIIVCVSLEILRPQVTNKLEQNRQCISTHNTLDETCGYMKKELQLLNSIQENTAGGALLSETGRPKFLEFLSSCVKQIETSCSKVEGRIKDDQAERGALDASLERQQDNQREYFRAVKEFKEVMFPCLAKPFLLSGKAHHALFDRHVISTRLSDSNSVSRERFFRVSNFSLKCSIA